MSKPISTLTLTTIKRNQRFQGPTSSAQVNALQDELLRDFISLQGQWNNGIVPLVKNVPDGTEDAGVNAFVDGLSGETLYAKASATSDESTEGYYNSLKDRPNT